MSGPETRANGPSSETPQPEQPETWEFVDRSGTVLFQSDKLDEIARAIREKNIPRDALCRKNSSAGLRSIEESFAIEHPELAALLAASAGVDVTLYAGGGAILGLAVGMGVSILTGLAPLFIGISAAALGGAIGLALGRSKT
jgi:hypothetical protein